MRQSIYLQRTACQEWSAIGFAARAVAGADSMSLKANQTLVADEGAAAEREMVMWLLVSRCCLFQSASFSFAVFDVKLSALWMAEM